MSTHSESAHARPAHIDEAEWHLRCDLAAAYRLVAMFGWDDLVFTHISARVDDARGEPTGAFLINPYGLMFEEMTASSLVKVDARGVKLEDSPHAVNPAGFVLHAERVHVRADVGVLAVQLRIQLSGLLGPIL